MLRKILRLSNKNLSFLCQKQSIGTLKRPAIALHISSIYKPFPTPMLLPCHVLQMQLVRHKSKGPKKKQHTESETDTNESEDDDHQMLDKNSKILYINVTSMRVDAILKTALGMARTKIETLFYENKIRVNGEKVPKKSASVREGDEIDLIRGPDLRNPNFINVARVEVLSVKPKEETIEVKVRRCKSLSIEAY